MVSCIIAKADDKSLGTWKLNVARSTYEGASFPVKNLVMIREAKAGGVKVSQTWESAADGTARKMTYTARYDGKEYVVEGVGAPFDRISIKQLDANTFVDERKKSDGLFHATVRTVISKDWKTLTTVAVGMNSTGKAFTSTLVHERQ